MAKERSMQVSLFMWLLVAGLLSQNLVIPVMSSSFEDQKNYYTPDPHAGSPPTGSHGSPPHGSHTPPSHGGGSYNPTPSIPSGGNCGTPPHTPTPSTPSGGGYYNPPTSGSISPPTSGSISPPTPNIVSPPTTPTIDPGTPSIPSPPFFPDPNSPFSCNYWRTHPAVIWGLLGWWGTTGNAFGAPTVSGFGSNMNLLQALSNTRTDGLGALYREGTASWLNSLAIRRFPYTTKQVRESFLAALHSDRAAAAQARLFKLANEGHVKPRD